jgi:hypothetical protein
VEEVTTFRDQVRLTPVAIPDPMVLDLGERVWKATYHLEKRTLNLVPDRVFGADLVRWVEAWLREAIGEPREPALESPVDGSAAPEKRDTVR